MSAQPQPKPIQPSAPAKEPDGAPVSPDNDPKSLKQNFVVAVKGIVEYIATADTANPSVLDLVQTCADGLDAVFEKLSSRFETLPESPDAQEEPNYSAEDTQGSGNPITKSAEVGALLIAKALDMPVPSGSEISLEPTKTSKWKAVTSDFSADINKARTAISNNQRIVFYMSIGLCLSSLDELLSLVQQIIPDTEVKQWKRVMVELRSNMAGAARSVKPGKNASRARAFLSKVSDCCAKLQERVKFQEANVNTLSKKMSIFLGNRS